MERFKISVIIAIYNVQPYLEKCLESVVNQTYSNLEIICIDDGSTDGSGEICDAFGKRDSRFSVIHKENGGEPSVRNMGIERATGDFISFIDGDDWLEPGMYRTLAEQITGEEIDVSACGYFEDYGGVSRQIKNKFPVPEHPMDVRDFLKYIYIRDLYRGVAGYLWSRLIKASVIKDNHLQFDGNLSVGYDQIFAAQCYMRSRHIVYTSTPLYHYVQREGSAMHDAQRRLKGFGSCAAYQMMIDLYEENHVDQTVVDYVKRFYVYHAIKLLRFAFDVGLPEQAEALKLHIRKYFDIYCRTNSDYPERIAEAQELLAKTI